MAVIYRTAVEADREKYLDFINLVFSNAHCPHDFQALIPKVYGKGRKTAHMQNIAVREEDGAVRGLVAVMPNTLHILGRTLNAGLVGTVSVHPYARGEGHMKALMNLSIEKAKDSGCDIMVLGGQRQRYEYFGFTQGGMRHDYKVNATNLRHILGDAIVSDIEIIDVQPQDTTILAACAQLHATRGFYAERPAEEFYTIATTWFNKLKAVTVNNALFGFIILNSNRIADFCLKDYTQSARVLKRLMQITNQTSFELHAGDHETDLNRELAKIAESKSLAAFEMLRILNFKNVLSAMLALKASYSRLEEGKLSFVIDDAPITIRVENGIAAVTEEADEKPMVLSAAEAQHLFFGIDGELLVGRLPFGWQRLPLFYPNPDQF